jgi:hypothetical protein
LTEIHHDILMIDREFERLSIRTGASFAMIDREFERLSIRTGASFAGSSALVLGELKRPESARSKTQFHGDVS